MRNNAATEIRAVIDGWMDAMRTKDADKVVSYYAPGTVMFTLAPPLKFEGTGTTRLRDWFDSFRGGLEYEVRDLDIVAGDEVAFSRSLNRIAGTRADGTRADLWTRATLCFRKIDGDWKVAHEHDSVPFYMDGGAKAALDLKP